MNLIDKHDVLKEVPKYQISVLEGSISDALLWKMFHWKHIRLMPVAEKARTIEFGAGFHNYRIELGLENRVTSNLFVIDRNGFIRSHVTGAPQEGDIEKLHKLY